MRAKFVPIRSLIKIAEEKIFESYYVKINKSNLSHQSKKKNAGEFCPEKVNDCF